MNLIDRGAAILARYNYALEPQPAKPCKLESQLQASNEIAEAAKELGIEGKTLLDIFNQLRDEQ